MSVSYYPLLCAPGCSGYVTLYNFAPNNWEEGSKRTRFVHLTWSDGVHWCSRRLAHLEYGAMKTVRAADVVDTVPEHALALLSLSDDPLPDRSDRLPSPGLPHTSYPNWRATLGLVAKGGASTCYQGEVDPFPAPGSMLTFGHFLQVGAGIENYLLLLNLEASPQARTAALEVRDAAAPERVLAQSQVRNNSINVVMLDWPGMVEEQLPLVVCLGMSGIPLYFSQSIDGRYLSLEHTHPPASTVVHGRRWDAQKILKQQWFSKASQH
ncbi:MAG: hypothetical protein ACK53H_07725 [Betaproteobacteria bacterium]